jgi:hypothetical protein
MLFSSALDSVSEDFEQYTLKMEKKYKFLFMNYNLISFLDHFHFLQLANTFKTTVEVN